jgi:hypothetical protein
VLSDRQEDVGAARCRRKGVSHPALHDPAGERRVIWLRDEEVGGSMRPDDHDVTWLN